MTKIELRGKTILITGAAGFIVSNLVKCLFQEAKNATIIGIDNMNDYYDVSLKEYRLNEIEKLNSSKSLNSWVSIKGDIADKSLISQLM